MISWVICLYSNDSRLVVGQIYDVVSCLSEHYFIELDDGSQVCYDKKWFMPDTEKLFSMMLTTAHMRGFLVDAKEDKCAK